MRRDIKLELRTTYRQGESRSATTAFTLSYRGPDPRTWRWSPTRSRPSTSKKT
jgi:hypothetical protein